MQETTTPRSQAVQVRQDNLHFMRFWTEDQGKAQPEAAVRMLMDLRFEAQESKNFFDEILGEVLNGATERVEELLQAKERYEYFTARAEDAVAIARHFLLAQVREAVLEFPQYDGGFEDWVLVLVKNDITTKGGLQFEADTFDSVTLAQPEFRSEEYGTYRTVRSRLTGFQVSIPEEDLEVL